MPPKAKKGKKVRYSRWLVTVNPLKPKLGSYPGGERGLRIHLQLEGGEPGVEPRLRRHRSGFTTSPKGCPLSRCGSFPAGP